jgi:pimeloyl-ACP methyl ester carboxylesterase
LLAENGFDTGIVTLNYAEGGRSSGLPLVLLHGGCTRWQSFSALLPTLAQRWHVYAPDMRRHGRSGRVPGAYCLGNFAADIAAFLEGVVGEPVVLYGASMGGFVGILVAARHPQLVRALIIGDSPLDPGKNREGIRRRRERFLFWRDLAGGKLSRDEIGRVVRATPLFPDGMDTSVPARQLLGEDHPWFPELTEELYHLDPEVLSAIVEFEGMHADFDYERLLPRIACLVLIIQGNPEPGGRLTDQEVERAITLLPRATVLRMETVGHMLDPELVLHALTAFLESL